MNTNGGQGVNIAGHRGQKLDCSLEMVLNVEVFLYKVDCTLNKYSTKSLKIITDVQSGMYEAKSIY